MTIGSTNLIPFTTSAQSKPEIIRNLIKLFEDKVIKIPKNTDLIKELYDFKSKRNAITGNLQFSNTDGKHDDMVMSLAICAYCAAEEQDGGVTLFFMITFGEHLEISKYHKKGRRGFYEYINNIPPEKRVKMTREIDGCYPLNMSWNDSYGIHRKFTIYTEPMDLVAWTVYYVRANNYW